MTFSHGLIGNRPRLASAPMVRSIPSSGSSDRNNRSVRRLAYEQGTRPRNSAFGGDAKPPRERRIVGRTMRLTRAIRYVPTFEATTMLQVEPAMNRFGAGWHMANVHLVGL